MRLRTLATAALIGVTLLAGCSSSDDEPDESSSSDSPTASPSASASSEPSAEPTASEPATSATPSGVLVERATYALALPEEWKVEKSDSGDDRVWALLDNDPIASLVISRHDLDPMPPLAELVELGENLMSTSTKVDRVEDTTVAGSPAYVLEGDDMGYPRITLGIGRSDGIVTLALTYPGTMPDARKALAAMLAGWQWR